MAPRREGFIQWITSEQKEIVYEDLVNGTLSLYAKEVPVEEAWKIYRDMPEFEGVMFEQFEARLEAHRTAIRAKKRISRVEILFFSRLESGCRCH